MFQDRADAGHLLGLHLAAIGVTASVVCGLPRGGVPIAAEVARSLGIPLDVIVVRKLGLPSHPEVAMGAIGEERICLIDAGLVRRLGVTQDEMDAVEVRERAVLNRRAAALHAQHPPLDLSGRTVLIVDDGIATGAKASAACFVARERGAARVIVAAPVGARDAVTRVDGADQVICLELPADFLAVGQYYRDFSQTTDADVSRILSVRPLR
ncbi:putative phosphoribosyl transferase [Microbacterium foliorum]|uniref:Phosphoribosyl transferase n=1 Tax=Microbacterium foliorum TaxID=104336 RepID=A0ABU1HVL7_9MICO|nr:phosphoribosyltransferase family protein [Microbacterium foliorum]MDR6144100.1 putative phosphoribosyl transferase [Microbacterium foliorum]